MDNYLQKYIKYKIKYLDLKNNIYKNYKNKLLKGGDRFYINEDNVHLINRKIIINDDKLNVDDMELHFNPIYGYFLCECDLLRNLYHLNPFNDQYVKYIKEKYNINKKNINTYINKYHNLFSLEYDSYIYNIVNILNKNYTLSSNQEIQYIIKFNQIYHMFDDKIIPVNNILYNNNINPYFLGQFIGFYYIYIKFKNEIINEINKINKSKNQIIIQDNTSDDIKYKILIDYFIELINFTENKENIKKYFLNLIYFNIIDTANITFSFHILLNILCWKLNNINDLNKYYEGIKYIFDIFKFNITFKEIIYDDNNKLQDSFEYKMFLLTKIDFKIIGQMQSKVLDDIKYPDCGETTMRNFINLLCFNGFTFDINKLIPLKPINQLIIYYVIFNNFEKQLDDNFHINENDYKNIIQKYNQYELEIFINHIYNNKLNARDAWSYLIINYANENLICLRTKDNYNYELNSGLSKDNNKTNFVQLLNNLFKIENLNELKDLNNLKLDLKLDLELTINDCNLPGGIGECNIEHTKFGEYILNFNSGHYYIEKKNKDNKKIEINIKYNNNYKDNMLSVLYNKNNNNNNNNNKLLYNKITNIQNYVNYNNNNIFLILSLSSLYNNDEKNKIIIDYNYENIKDIMLMFLMFLKSNKNNKNNINNINILNEYKYKSDNFNYINELNLTKLNFIFSQIKNLDQLKDLFTSENSSISSINILDNNNIFININDKIISIGDNFLLSCFLLQNLTLTLNKVVSIDDSFLSQCYKLLNLTLNIDKVESIGNDFLSNCTNLQNLTLNLNNVQKIGNNFLSNCTNLLNLTLNIDKVESIGNDFLSRCNELQNLTLNINKVESIGNYFLSHFSKLNKLILNLDKVVYIGDHFLSFYDSLQDLTLKLDNVKSIDDYFLLKCKSLQNLTLSLNTEILNTFFRNIDIYSKPSLNLFIINKSNLDFILKENDLQLIKNKFDINLIYINDEQIYKKE